MSQSSCNVCSCECFVPYNATLWAIRNPWFRNHSSLAGALGERETQEASSHHPLAAFCIPGLCQDHRIAPTDVKPESVPGPTASDPISGDHDGSDNSMILTDLQNKKPLFCRVGRCRYWHTDRKQVKRHRDSHFRERFCWLCPNETDTCPSSGREFRRKDAVLGHCRRYSECGVKLRANGGEPKRQGEWATKLDLKPQDPTFHIHYRKFDGRNRRM